MKYCKFCGTQLDDDAVCTCEEAQKELNEKQTEARAYETDDDKKADLAAGEMKLPSDMEVPSKNQSDFSLLACDIRTFAFIGIGSVIAITIIVMIISAVVGGSYKKPLNDLQKGLNKGDFDIFAEAFPEDIADDMDDNDGDEAFGNCLDALEDEYGKNLKFKYKVDYKEKISDRKLEKIEDIQDIKLKKAYEVDLAVKVKGKEDKDDIEFTVFVGKVKDEGWKLVYMDEGDTDEMFELLEKYEESSLRDKLKDDDVNDSLDDYFSDYDFE